MAIAKGKFWRFLRVHWKGILISSVLMSLLIFLVAFIYFGGLSFFAMEGFNRRTMLASMGLYLLMFLIVSILAVIINTSLVRFITTNVSPQFNLTPREWLMAAKVMGSGVSLVWNFLGYKLIVFKK